MQTTIEQLQDYLHRLQLQQRENKNNITTAKEREDYRAVWKLEAIQVEINEQIDNTKFAIQLAEMQAINLSDLLPGIYTAVEGAPPFISKEGTAPATGAATNIRQSLIQFPQPVNNKP